MHCIQCGHELVQDMCLSCKNSIISLYELGKITGVWIYCWNCGNYIEDDEERCTSCDYTRDQIINHLDYIECSECHNKIDPVFDCPYCNDYIEPINLIYQPGKWKFINKHECPFVLECKGFKHDKETNLNYNRDQNGNYSISTRPIVNMIYYYNGNKYNTDIAEKIKFYFGLQKLHHRRIEKLEKIMPKKIFVKYDINGKRQLNQKDLDNWFHKYKK